MLVTDAGSAPLELWGGLECSVLRVGDTWRNQVRETGHQRRPSDLDQIAALGIRTLRFPVLWEQVPPALPHSAVGAGMTAALLACSGAAFGRRWACCIMVSDRRVPIRWTWTGRDEWPGTPRGWRNAIPGSWTGRR